MPVAKKEDSPPYPMLRIRACDVYIRCILEYSHDPNFDSFTNRSVKSTNETLWLEVLLYHSRNGGDFDLMVLMILSICIDP